MSIVSYLYAFVVGVDTHARNHVYSIITVSLGRCRGRTGLDYAHATTRRAASAGIVGSTPVTSAKRRSRLATVFRWQ